MRRPLYITELAAQPFPLGLIGHLLQEHKSFLQTICFQDNELGDSAHATEAYNTKIVLPLNHQLERNGKPLRLSTIEVDHGRHHTVKISYQARINGSGWTEDSVRLSLFLVSKKSIAMERKAEEDGEEFTVVAPRRGAVVTKRPKNRKRKRRYGATA
ncbi:MAG: hypothetical protein WC869_00300 [Phycisphaerae bacterium]|jgi:hypothetical protein